VLCLSALFTQLWRQYEQALTLFCPEAACQALLEADAFDFVEGMITVRSDTVSEIRPSQGVPLGLMNAKP
jgi:hypothetical protein